MKRREFLKSSLLAGAAASVPLTIAAAENRSAAARDFYELRLYRLIRGPMLRRFEEYCREAAIPATNRAGAGPVGVFSVLIGPDNATMYVLIRYSSLEAFATFAERLRDDAEYQKAGAAFINAPISDPPYVRVESSLMVAFDSIPKLEVPALTTEKKPRIFELRTYEGHSKKANRKKIEMFNTGEIGIFRRVGITPVFFGETLIGSKLPNLTYMTVFENMAEREKNWAAFGSDPEWQALRSKPEFADTVSNSTITLLRPTAYSQI